MKLALAQTQPKLTIAENIEDHYLMAEIAGTHGANLLLFPEMSLTSYQRAAAGEMAFSEEDQRLKKLKRIADNFNLIIIVGAPIRLENSLFIGAFVIYPGYRHSIYTKQFLHQGEEHYFVASNVYNPIFSIDEEVCSVAICADINHDAHFENAQNAGTTIYAASIFFTPGGIAGAHERMKHFSKKHGMAMMLSNYCGSALGMEAGGRSAFWDHSGKLVGEMVTDRPGMLIVERRQSEWLGISIVL